MLEEVQTIVVGAGVVGLAIARALALSGREVIVVEETDAIGTGISSRNSEVIHAGIYYPKGSLKARFCVAGKQALYEYCRTRNIEHNRIGKLIVATEDSEVPALDGIKRRAEANGVADLRFVDGTELRELEPNIRVSGALFSPSTGLVDSHALMLSFKGEAEAAGAMVAFSSPVVGGRVEDGRFIVSCGGDADMDVACRELVIAAGLDAQGMARKITSIPPESIPPLYYAKGSYFVISGKSPFNHLIYPVPVPGGLGTHSTLDLGGQTKFGPDVEWVEKPDYDVDPARAETFYEAIRRYWPDLPDGALQPGYVGIRPKLAGPDAGKYEQDFVIQDAIEHGIPGLVCLYGIESPGLTSSLAIAAHVASRFDGTDSSRS